MYLSDSWSFLLKLDNDVVVPVDLSEEDDRGDIEPVRDGALHCTIGKKDGEQYEVHYIYEVWEYAEDKPFNDKFSTFQPITMEQFVRRLIDANVAFDNDTEEEAAELRKHYGV